MINKQLTPSLMNVAPMLDWTDRHCRYLLRLISKHTLLYSEMITTGAILQGDPVRHLAFDPFEKPVALQLGGSDPMQLAKSAKLAEDFGYDEINLNIGCPSQRVQKGAFGACLMAEPDLVAACVDRIRSNVKLPVTVKTRIGIDDQDDYDFLYRFIETVKNAGCETFVIHARKAILQGLSPRQNREIPPLRYDVVYRIVQDFPTLNIIINGGIQSLEVAKQQLAFCHGVMMGRAIMKQPYLLSKVDQMIYDDNTPVKSEAAILISYVDYIARQLSGGIPLGILVRPTLGFFQGQPCARRFRRYLSENTYQKGQDEKILIKALETSGFINNCYVQ